MVKGSGDMSAIVFTVYGCNKQLVDHTEHENRELHFNITVETVFVKSQDILDWVFFKAIILDN